MRSSTRTRRAPSPAALTVGVVDGGFIVPGARASEPGLRILTDHEIFRRERRIRRHRRYGSGTSLESITALKPGDYVVHLEHGVGIYRGIEQVFVRESTIEVAVIEYEGGDRLNVPLYRIDQVERYRSRRRCRQRCAAAASAQARRQAMGAAARQDARGAAGDDAGAPRSLCAPPRGGQGPRVSRTATWQRQLESSFLFEDTPDQRKATVEVKATWSPRAPWIACSWATSATAKRRSPCARRSRRCSPDARLRCSCPRRFSPSSTGARSRERLADFPVSVRTL